MTLSELKEIDRFGYVKKINEKISGTYDALIFLIETENDKDILSGLVYVLNNYVDVQLVVETKTHNEYIISLENIPNFLAEKLIERQNKLLKELKINEEKNKYKSDPKLEALSDMFDKLDK